MQIHGSLPMHIARAYGVHSPSPARASAPTTPAKPAGPIARIQPDDAFETSAANRSQRIESLIAGRVDHPIDFTPTPAPQSEALQMYTRAADRIEAATSVHIGQSLDVRG